MKISNLAHIHPQRIANIVFDWGGVITEIDFDRAIEGFKKMGYNGFTTQSGNYPHNALMQQFEIGRVEPEQVIEFLQSGMSRSVTPDEIWKVWNSLLLTTRKEHLDLLQKLKKKFRLALLSNTNIIHVSHYRQYLQEVYDLDFFSLFEKHYLSYELHMRKPDPEIFEHVISDSAVIPGETLFIDDLETNIDAADRGGFIALHFPKNAPLEKLFEPWDD